MKKISVFLLFLITTASLVNAQIIDHIVAIVGNEIILKSDIENQYIQVLSQGNYSDEGDIKCDILEELLFQKLLLIQADLDSITVTDKEVNNELDRRLNVFIAQLGSEKKLEEYYGKTILEIKNEFTKLIRDQMLCQKVQSSITENIKVTPSEVKKVFDEIPKDSLPKINAYMELSEIVIKPKVGKSEKDEIVKKLNEIRERILNGESFSTMAVLYSEDPGSAAKGGELGFVGRTDLVPEFAQIGFALTNTNDVSRVVETEFGFHIIQLIEKRGNLMNFRHILMLPKTSIEQISISEHKADSIHSLINNNLITFEAAVIKFSDSETKFNGGKITNPYIGNSKLTEDVIDPQTRKATINLKLGEYSKPFLSATNQGAKVFKIVKLINKVEEHTANLKDDYQEIQEYALQKEQQKIIENWIKSKINNTFIKIDDSYKNCKFKFADWTKKL